MKPLFRTLLPLSALLLLVGCGTSVQPQLTETIPHQLSSLEEVTSLPGSIEESLVSPATTAEEQASDSPLIHQEDIQLQSASPSPVSTDPIWAKLYSAEISPGPIPDEAMGAFYRYLKEDSSLFAEVEFYTWTLSHYEDQVLLEFSDTSVSSGGFYGTSLYYILSAGTVSTAEEYRSANDSKNDHIRKKLESTFYSYGDAATDAIDAMVIFLSTSEGSWMWDKCQNWNWEAEYDAEQDYFILHCTGPMATDGTIPVQSLSSKGGNIMGFPSGYVNSTDQNATTPEDPQISDPPHEPETPVTTEIPEEFPESPEVELDSVDF